MVHCLGQGCPTVPLVLAVALGMLSTSEHPVPESNSIALIPAACSTVKKRKTHMKELDETVLTRSCPVLRRRAGL
jgi:hypothetical protein